MKGYEPSSDADPPPAMVEKKGVEPLTFRLQGGRSDRLSYNPSMVLPVRLERTPSRLGGRRSIPN